MKILNLNKVLKLYLPSLFFIISFIVYASGPFYLVRYIIAGVFCIPLIINLFVQNIHLSRVIGSVIVLLFCYLMLALYSDVVNGKASVGYIWGFLLFLVCIGMAVLLIIGYDKSKQLTPLDTEEVK